ncbi:MAG TPA: sugar ABC transporter substrate-binding protein [Candidatus Methylomirabilis sp.]|nr:sugar ABC transporter substrate-binding protein [Candidatus Methylomirabilis sp.]
MSRLVTGERGMTRRDLLRAGAAVTAGAAIGPFVHTLGHAQSFNWQRFKGKEIFLIFFKNPWDDEIVKYVPEFEALTGIKVKYEILPEIQARQKLTVEMTAASGGLDAFLSSLHVEKRRFWRAGWYEPLNMYLENKTLTPPDYDWNDFTPTAKAAVTQSDKTVSAIPSFVDPDILFYRKDIFQEKGLKPPKTMEEMEALAQKLHNPPNLYGFVARGLKNANASPWAYILYAFGGDYLTPDRKSAMNTAAWVKGLEYYSGMLRRYAPPGVVNFNWYECSAAFMQGQVAMYYDGVNFATQFEDKEKSKVAGKVGYTLLPAGPGGLHTCMFTSGMSVSAQSRNKEAAWFFVQWASNKQNCVRELVAGVGGGRASTWSHPDVKAKSRMPADWYTAFLESLKIGRNGLPEIVDVTQYRDIFGLAIQKAIEGGKPADLVAQAHKEFQAMLDQTEK